MALALSLLHRCSMGAGAGIFSLSMSSSTCSMKPRSAPVGLCREPAGKATSLTHCSPPQSNCSRSTLRPTRKLSLSRQNSACVERDVDE